MSINRNLNLRPATIDIANYVDGIQAYQKSAGSVASKSYKDVEFTFTKEYKSIPIVLASIVTGSTSSDIGAFTAAITDRTLTTTTIRVFNNSENARSPAISILAIGTV